MASKARAKPSTAKRCRPEMDSAISLRCSAAAIWNEPPPRRVAGVSMTDSIERKASYIARMYSSTAAPCPPPTSTVTRPELVPASTTSRVRRPSSCSETSTSADCKEPKFSSTTSSRWLINVAPVAAATSSIPSSSIIPTSRIPLS